MKALDACVHCGFCLQACPTFLATGDEADSPRGRIELMRALDRGELGPGDAALQYHLDRCLGCRACEPVCPSGVQYGRGLEEAREILARTRGVAWPLRLLLWLLTAPGVSRVTYWTARVLRATGLPRRLAGWGRLRFALGMLAATKPDGTGRYGTVRGHSARMPAYRPVPSRTVSLFRGCVMDGLFSHVHDATIRTLEVNGYRIQEVRDQVCCGALHEHAGLPERAHALALRNVAAFGDVAAPIAVNSAGCGAWMKDYGRALGTDAAAAFSARVRDVTELLAGGREESIAAGAPLDVHVAYDPPCHLLHAQRISGPPLRVFAAIPLLELVSVPGAADCCGSAGVFTLTQPDMSQAVLRTKLEHLRSAAPQIVATGNPGCLMQLGAGLAAADIDADVRHPVELLDAAYAAAGLYE